MSFSAAKCTTDLASVLGSRITSGQLGHITIHTCPYTCIFKMSSPPLLFKFCGCCFSSAYIPHTIRPSTCPRTGCTSSAVGPRPALMTYERWCVPDQVLFPRHTLKPSVNGVSVFISYLQTLLPLSVCLVLARQCFVSLSELSHLSGWFAWLQLLQNPSLTKIWMYLKCTQ